ncbi:MAG TPA: preprotein translocase subunit YajC [Acidimicrobiales bacterium]
MTAASAVIGPFIDAATQPAKSGFNPSILIFAVISGAFYFLIYRPQQKKQKAAREVGNSFEVGDEVVTAGGIVGRVLDITDDRVTLETSVGASFVVLRPYILRKLEPAQPPTDVVDGSADEEHEPEPPAAPPTMPDAADDHPAKGTTSKSKGTADPKGPTMPPPPDDPDGTDASGADGPPLI